MSSRIHQTKKRFECACLAFIQVLLFKVLTLCHSPQTASGMLVINMLSCSHELPQKFILFSVYALCPFIFFPQQSFVSPYLSWSFTHRSSNIRPGQFGYGRVPFSLPLHRPNRQARHTDNSTESPATELADNEDAVEANENETEEADSEGGDGEAVSTDTPAADETPTATTTARAPQRHVDRPRQTSTEHVRSRFRPSHTFGRSSSPSVPANRQRFDWHSVTAPPPPVPPLPRPNAAAGGSTFSTSLHRPSPVHTDRDVHPGFSPQIPSASNIYPLQYSHVPHLGVEPGRDGGRGSPQVYRCSGPEREYRRCFSQVRFSQSLMELFYIKSVIHFPTNCLI